FASFNAVKDDSFIPTINFPYRNIFHSPSVQGHRVNRINLIKDLLGNVHFHSPLLGVCTIILYRVLPIEYTPFSIFFIQNFPRLRINQNREDFTLLFWFVEFIVKFQQKFQNWARYITIQKQPILKLLESQKERIF